MNFEDIKNELNDPKFNLNIGVVLLNIHTTNLMNSYRLKAILEKQIEILELQKGKTGQELENSLNLEIEKINEEHSNWLKNDLTKFVHDCSPD